MTSGRRTLAAVAVMLAAPTMARADVITADELALPCRPTIACTADIGPPGHLELEIGYLFRRFRAPAHQQSVPFLLKLTVTPWLQLQLGGNGPTFANAPVATRYVDDIVGAAKLHLPDPPPRWPSLSLWVALSVPLASAQGYVRTYDILTAAYATDDFGPLHVDLNVGLNAWRITGPVFWQPWVALAVSTAPARWLIAMVETYYFGDASPIAPRDGGLLGAVGFVLRPNLVLDGGGDLGFFPSSRAYSLFLGLTAATRVLW
jgi:hypothetical protein